MSNPRGNYQQKPIMEKICKDCGIKITPANTYRRKKGIDNRCIPCRIAANTKTNKYDYVLLNCKGEDANRGDSKGWTRWMIKHEHYFNQQFHLPATRENIRQEANKLF